MSLHNPEHRYKTCGGGGPEALASTTIFKKCGVKTSSRRQEHYIIKTHFTGVNTYHKTLQFQPKLVYTSTDAKSKHNTSTFKYDCSIQCQIFVNIE